MIDKEQFLKDLVGMLGSDEETTMETDLIDIEGWDSFSMMAFIAMVDDKYSITFEPFAVAEAVLVEDLYDVVNNALERK